jgi:hypothetical protein
MKLILSFLILFTGMGIFAHPLHLSVTNITIENNEIKISMSTFRDDWEVAYFHFHSREIDFKDPVNREIPWFMNYLEKSFQISLKSDATPLKFELDTVTVNADNMLIELLAVVEEEPNSLYIYNTFLTDIFPDQTNLVIIELNDKESGIKFDIEKHDEEITLR